MIVGIAAAVQDQRVRSSFSAFALFSECLRGAARLVKTAQELSLSCFVLCII